ncbi:UNVERIFIED_CONTAM: hypothetical protein FKN15_073358 [Acipenser sinensis]
MSGGSRLKRLEEGVLQDGSPVSLQTLLDLLVCVFEELRISPIAQESHVTSFLQWAEPLARQVKQLRLQREDFEILKVIGRGNFSEVAIAKMRRTERVYAMKIMNKWDMVKRGEIARFQEEREVMVRGDRRWITELHYAFQDDNNLEHFEFPRSVPEVSEEARDLIGGLVCGRQQRLGRCGFEDFKGHPFFAGINWEKLRHCQPPFQPEVMNSTDTSNFDVVDDCLSDVESLSEVLEDVPLGVHLAFVGYSYTATKETGAVDRSRDIMVEISREQLSEEQDLLFQETLVGGAAFFLELVGFTEYFPNH